MFQGGHMRNILDVILMIAIFLVIATNTACVKQGSTDLDGHLDHTHIQSDPTPTPTPPPTAIKITLSGPADGATVSGTLTLTIAVTGGAALSSVVIRADSEILATLPGGKTTYTHQLDTRTLGDGFVTLTAVATEVSSRKTTSNPLSVRVLNADPTPTPTPSSSPTPTPSPTPAGTTVRVPQDYPSLQSAINAAPTGSTVLVSPGTYPGGVTVSGKVITIASLYLTTGNASYVDQTTIDGGAPIINIASSAAGSRVVGLTITKGNKGIQAFGYATVLNNKFVNVGSDAMSLESCGGIIKNNSFTGSTDDAIDMDDPGESLVENNIIKNSSDDGIEMRNFDYSGPVVTITIRNNSIDGSREDGIQLIDYPANSHRIFKFDHNLITHSTDAGIGLMDSGETVEDFRAAAVPERVYVTNNTLVSNHYGVTGGANMIAVNNIVASSSATGMKGIAGLSRVSNNLFWANGLDQQGCSIDATTTFNADPMFSADYHLMTGSAAVDRGTANLIWRSETVIQIPSSQFLGLAPDLGAYEAR